MGITSSKVDNVLGEQFPDREKYFGLENFGNTCYCNSVLQALYFCVPFREKLLDYYSHYNNPDDAEDDILICLADLFTQISCHKKKTGVISPRRFLHRMKKECEPFRSFMHQDAHEFLNYVLNGIVNILEKESDTHEKDFLEASSYSLEYKTIPNGAKSPLANGFKEPHVTWVHKIFQGILINETRCLRCETVTAKDETFLDLSIDVEENSSITSCLKNFCSTETLNADDKFFCDQCCSLQEAQKRMKIKKPPRILVIHLKRFKYMENLALYKKLSYRVVFPMELKLTDIVVDPDTEYSLFAVVIHVGIGPTHGHYVSAVKSHGHWLHFDDDNVHMINESALQTYFGSARDSPSNADNGYLLFYERIQSARAEEEEEEEEASDFGGR